MEVFIVLVTKHCAIKFFIVYVNNGAFGRINDPNSREKARHCNHCGEKGISHALLYICI